MKFFGTLTFVALLMLTWYITNSEAAIPLETHIGIQSQMISLIEGAVRAQKPKASEIQMESLWTEPIGGNRGDSEQVKVHFIYRFHEPSESEGQTESVIHGEGILERQTDDESGLERWTLQKIKTTGDSVIFDQPLLIKTGDEAPDSTEPPKSE